ncbi:TlyA family RNA methyltransferase [Cloacibacillus sp. An23]|uniref:TlyA family RNA methyltransferase n=1 Tax=Cloacibacillus sp. An23 TaxID=1965591 RepID=UPI000B39D007|nr:TlyA family RNA methyltransferase [Cloacibacillus sp. An23]OUO92301.1 TlyA family rRNA (cytidine-2'-O)-methyltransferase [Cloacibacillus sp. An23]
MSAKLVRLDKLITDRKLAPSRTAARVLIEEGRVRVNGAEARKPASMVGSDAGIVIDAPEREWVSRGAYKLLRALERFPIDARGKRCVDIGASTGGFTDVLLANGASLVYAVDVGYGQLAWKLRGDPRVRVMERTNARNLTLEMIDGEKADVIVSDASFISLTLLFGVMENLLNDDGVIAVLVKPQFEAGRGRVGKGVITDPKLHEDILNEVADFIDGQTGLSLEEADYSPIRGPEGNIEFLFFLRHKTAGRNAPRPDFHKIVEEAHLRAAQHPNRRSNANDEGHD